MATQFQKDVKAALQAEWMGEQIIRCLKSGQVEFKRSYFYRCGYNAEKMGEKVAAVLEAAGVVGWIISTEDRFNFWPKTSYFVATITPVEVK